MFFWPHLNVKDVCHSWILDEKTDLSEGDMKKIMEIWKKKLCYTIQLISGAKIHDKTKNRCYRWPSVKNISSLQVFAQNRFKKNLKMTIDAQN